MNKNSSQEKMFDHEGRTTISVLHFAQSMETGGNRLVGSVIK